jgi:uncharacterized protein with HEPN domain
MVSVDRSGRNRTKEGLPARIAAECSGIAEDIRDQNDSIRYDKIVAARARMANGYYNSGHVVRAIASRLLSEGQPE